ncbi:pseudouridine synthase [Hypoxylon argillaceum]|nr:pseudouridine synthase [Hypoxylon argillaceum]
MWSFNRGTCRSWCPDRLHQLAFTAAVAAAARRASQCRFSTTPITQVNTAKQPKMAESAAAYGRWTTDALIKRIQRLEYEIQAKNQPGSSVVTSTDTTTKPVADSSTEKGEPGPQRKKRKEERKIDPSKYSTRLIALKLAYLGKNYGGFEFQSSSGIPTIEAELWKAMVKGCLIFPENPHEVNWDAMEYSKCGRTDRGVSAFGQVIGIRVRSNRPLPKNEEEKPKATSEEGATEITAQDAGEADASGAVKPEKAPEREFDDLVDELPYARLLNRLLPPDIRILAWCPTTPADFSARHHCRERQYRYFFTQPAYSPLPSCLEDPKTQGSKKVKDGWLNIDAMRAAAKKFEGLHDFRNFCKIDPSKTQQSFQRRIFESSIVEVPDASTALPYLQLDEFRPPSSPSSPTEPSTTASPPPPPETFPKVYYIHVRGSAFLWHQIRCMAAVLFAVGQGLETPSIIDRLLDVAAEPRRPTYTIASDVPLVLWDCLFPADLDDPARRDAMAWVRVGEDAALNAHGANGLVGHLWEHWRERRMDELLAGQLLAVVASQADLSLQLNADAPRYAQKAQRVFEGANKARSVGAYVPMLKKERLATPQEAYDKEARRKGFDNSAHMQEVIAQRRAEAEAQAAAAMQIDRPVGSGGGEAAP